jgi:hypothetical protein
MTDDEMTVLLIAAQGESMIPIGRWEQPILALTERGLMQRNDASNYGITEKGKRAVKQEETERDAALVKELTGKTIEMETYLGDSVYASFDGYRIWLRTGDSGNQRIALEPAVYHALRDYGAKIWGLKP